MKDSYRLDQIYSILLKNNSVSVNELAEDFHVTPTTIRRDLIILEEKGMIRRERGQAFLREAPVTSDFFLDEKRRIARAAVKLVRDHMSMVLDSGTTIEKLVDRLIEEDVIKDLNIVTPSLTTALKASRHYMVSMPGGAVMSEYESIVGPYVEEFFDMVNADVAFLGSTGIQDCDGLTATYPLQIGVKQKIVRCARKKIALLDSSKFLRRGIYEFCTFKDIDAIITVETKQNKDQIDRIRKLGVEVIVV